MAGEATARSRRFMRLGTGSAGGLAAVEVAGLGCWADGVEELGVEAAETARLARLISLSWRTLPEVEAFLRIVDFFLATAIFDPSARTSGRYWTEVL